MLGPLFRIWRVFLISKPLLECFRAVTRKIKGQALQGDKLKRSAACYIPLMFCVAAAVEKKKKKKKKKKKGWSLSSG
jgi:hypothetical protein